MALWDQLKSRLTDLQSNTKTQVGKYKSKDFAKASMAMCALIAAADGTISPEERRKTASFIGSNDALSVFDPSELQQHFEFRMKDSGRLQRWLYHVGMKRGRALSDRRAESVANVLSEQFEVPPENLVTQGYGEQYLKVQTDAPDRINRRVAVRRITPLMEKHLSAR